MSGAISSLIWRLSIGAVAHAQAVQDQIQMRFKIGIEIERLESIEHQLPNARDQSPGCNVLRLAMPLHLTKLALIDSILNDSANHSLAAR